VPTPCADALAVALASLDAIKAKRDAKISDLKTRTDSYNITAQIVETMEASAHLKGTFC
jgi:hypothetical protein